MSEDQTMNATPDSPQGEFGREGGPGTNASGGMNGPDESDSFELDQLRKDLEEAQQRNLRAQADLENYRKRVRRELEDEKRYAELPLLRNLLPVVDNIGRAIDAAGATQDTAGLLEGVKMVAQQLDAVLQQHHCKRIEAQDQPFDPHLHQAISARPTAETPPHTVLLVVQPGYQLHDRVIRPAQVIVSTEPTSENV